MFFVGASCVDNRILLNMTLRCASQSRRIGAQHHVQKIQVLLRVVHRFFLCCLLAQSLLKPVRFYHSDCFEFATWQTQKTRGGGKELEACSLTFAVSDKVPLCSSCLLGASVNTHLPSPHFHDASCMPAWSPFLHLYLCFQTFCFNYFQISLLVVKKISIFFQDLEMGCWPFSVVSPWEMPTILPISPECRSL